MRRDIALVPDFGLTAGRHRVESPSFVYQSVEPGQVYNRDIADIFPLAGYWGYRATPCISGTNSPRNSRVIATSVPVERRYYYSEGDIRSRTWSGNSFLVLNNKKSNFAEVLHNCCLGFVSKPIMVVLL